MSASAKLLIPKSIHQNLRDGCVLIMRVSGWRFASSSSPYIFKTYIRRAYITTYILEFFDTCYLCHSRDQDGSNYTSFTKILQAAWKLHWLTKKQNIIKNFILLYRQSVKNSQLCYRITAGDENVLFHFMQLESEKGILIAPVSNIEVQANNALYSYIVQTFRTACKRIHEILQHSIRWKLRLLEIALHSHKLRAPT